MKNFTFSLLLLFTLSHMSFGQCEIDNPSVDTWTPQPIVIEDFSGNVLLPDAATSAIRALFMFFGAAFDPAIGQILEDDPQGFMGIEQSADASEGDFAVKLQGGYDLNFADLYSVHDCTEIPDSFHVDIKHVGTEEDTISILAVYDVGLNELLQDTAQLSTYPAYVYEEFLFDDDVDYQTISLPVIENFEADVDTFYYLILSTTHNDSYFLVDNIRATGDTTMVACEFDNYPSFSLQQLDPICVCDGVDEEEPEGSFLLDVIPSDDYPPLVLILDENDVIQYISTDDITDLFEDDFCTEDELFAVQVLYNDDFDFNSANELSDLIGCFALSEPLALETIYFDSEELNITMSENGEELPDLEEIVICPLDDIIPIYSFNNPTDLDMTWLVLDAQTGFVFDQFDYTETRDFRDLPAGEYVTGGIAHPQGALSDLIGISIDEITEYPCWYPSQNFYLITVLENGDPGCISSTQDETILAAVQMQQNPVSDALVLSFSNDWSETATITVMNVSGQQMDVQKFENTPNQVTFDTESYPKGSYFVSIQSANKQATLKFVKI